MKYQDVGDRGDPSTDGILNKLDEIACLVAEQLIDDIHRLDNGNDLYALESNSHSQIEQSFSDLVFHSSAVKHRGRC